MRDDRAMSATGYDVVIEDVVAELFGPAVDHRELFDVIAKANDASEMHVLGAKPKKNKKKLVMNTVGQSLNALAIGAGTHALVMAGRDPRLNRSGKADAEAGKKTFARAASAPYRAWEKTRVHRILESKMGEVEPGKNAKYAIAAAGGGLALHTAELVGDSIAAQALHNQRKAHVAPSVITQRAAAKEKSIVKKGLDQIIQARRDGVINTETAIQMAAELVEKTAQKDEAKHIHREAEKLVPKTILKMKPLAKPAPKEPALEQPAPVAKSDEPVLTWSGEISKMDTDKRQVFGFCTVTHVNGEPVVDLQGDYVPLEEIEKAAYTYVVNSRKGGDMHKRDGEQPLHTSDMIESVIITPEKLEQWGLERDAMPYGWWVGFKVNDDAQWEMVKKRERAGFSIHGSGRRVEKMMEG